MRHGRGESRYRVNYANFLFRQGRFEDAEAQLGNVVNDTLYERREQALVLLGLTQQQMLKTDLAKRSFERAVTLNTRNTVALRQLTLMEFDAGNHQGSWQYLHAYRRVVERLDPELLLLGIHLARHLGESDAEVSYALALKNLYPTSKEYQSYLREQRR